LIDAVPSDAVRGAMTRSQTDDWVGVVLAAGRGRRLGGPKALLAWRWRGREVSLAAAHAAALRHAGATRVLVVTRGDIAERLRAVASGGPIEWVLSEAADELGPAGSLAAAAQHLASAASSPAVSPAAAVCITPVDCLPVPAEAVVALRQAWRDGARAARPRVDGRGGHPVVLDSSLLESYRGASPPTLRDLLRRLGADCADVALDDARLTVDLDTPDDWRRHAPAGLRDGPPRFVA
jgi:CTP:molybdopterin cytidylyltransferase MocA